MGRRMFGGGEGEWDPSWRGWWDEDPPFHVPVFVLSHRPRAPLSMEGGTSFTFVEGVEAAHELARAAAGDARVAVAGGAATVNQFLAVVLGAGERLFDGAGRPELELVATIASPAVTHVTYRLVRAA